MRRAVIALALLCLQSAARAEAPARTGDWSAFDGVTADGTRLCGIRAGLPGGAELRIIADEQDIRLVAHDPAWAIGTQGEARVAISISREVYVGAASVADPSTLVIESLAPDFLARFVRGSGMTADFGGVRWAIGLNGSGRAAVAMAACATAARHPVTS